MKNEFKWNQMRDTFLCPGLVFTMPSARGFKYYLLTYCYTGSCDVINLKTNKPTMLRTSDIRHAGRLIGQNYKAKP